MWIARGHHRPHANVVPSNFVAPYAPLRMCQDTSASQLPVVGSASKLHGHPHAQLQLWMYSASKFHFVGIDRTPLPDGASGSGYLIVLRGPSDSRSSPHVLSVTVNTDGRMEESTLVGPTALLRRMTIPIAVAVALVVAAAWYVTWTSTDFLMALMAPSTIASTDLVLFFALLVVMMVAMMLPSAMPMILAFRGMTRLEGGRPTKPAVIALDFMGSITNVLVFASAATLVAAGLWQVTRTKEVCLTHCTSPMGFVMRRWRSGRVGAWRMGLRHSMYCLGCCWLFMIVLFVAGSMSLVWMGGLSIVIFVEKVGVRPVLFSRAIGLGLVVLGALVGIRELGTL